MSDTEEYVQPPINVPFTKPMELASEPKQEEPAPFESSDAGLREAASELVDAPPEPDPIIVRDVQTGKPRPSNETLSAEQAGRELARYRNSIADQKEAASDAATAELIDHIQGNAANPALNPDLQPQVQVQPEQQQHQPQPEQTAEQYPPGVDPEVARVLSENPRVRAAIQAEVQQIEAAKQTYSEGLRANAELTARVLFSDFPELIGLTQEQLPGALKAMQHQNPERALAAVQRIQTAHTAVAQWQQTERVQNEQSQRQYRQQFNDYARQEDAKAEKMLPGLTDRKIADQAVTTLKNLGFSDSDLARAWNGEATISLRDARAQILLAKAALYDAAMAGAPEKIARNIPIVQRPGVSGARADEYDASQLSDLSRRLGQTGNVKDAARLLSARRANKG